jgi:glycosyltransferase involved in cell wall biosynthesis
MKVAFYAPLNAPDALVPSGDRLIARMLLSALGEAGHDVRLVSRLRSLDMLGSELRQQRLAAIGARIAQRLVRAYAAPGAWRPEVWLTYHLYHKAPDWIGPEVAAALRIPYAVAEASYARKHETGPWAKGLAAVAAALARADLVIGLKPGDERAVRPRLRPDARYESITPFLATAPFAAAHAQKQLLRAQLAARHGLDPEAVWLLAVGMMREGSKVASYQSLGRSLGRILDARWQLLVAGDGPAQSVVHASLQPLAPRVSMLGRVEGDALRDLYAASDLFVWPAIKEPIGMVFLEAQAAGLPVIAGDRPGVGSVVLPGRTAALVPEGDEAAFAAAVLGLVADPRQRAAMSRAALEHAARALDVATAGRAFAAALARFVEERGAVRPGAASQ